MPGTWRHLAARFFHVLVARPLDRDEVEICAGLLRPSERAAFFAQEDADQRHALESALAVWTAFPERIDLQRAALLHDIGKRHAHLGVIGRVIASIAAKLRIPVRGRLRLYLDHGAVAAVELGDLGAEALVVQFARHHHGERPPSFDAREWNVLEAADA